MSTPTSRTGEPIVQDEFIHHGQAAEAESSTVRNLFDLRVIIGGLFTLYGVYLTVYGALDGAAAVAKAAGVRINLWTGLGMLVLGVGFLLWAKLRPLTLERIAEGQAESVEHELGQETPREQRVRAGGH